MHPLQTELHARLLNDEREREVIAAQREAQARRELANRPTPSPSRPARRPLRIALLPFGIRLRFPVS